MLHHLLRALRPCLLSLPLAISACANFSAVDKPLHQWTPAMHERIGDQISGERSPKLLVFLAFSGGGTRAAAFAYGVLQELAHLQVMTENGPRPLLQEVDVISSVSGGSFTAAYYGLYGDKIFEDFEERFLRKNVEGELLAGVLNPVNWVRLLSATYGRSDLAAAYYDKILFNNATFSDLQRPGAPVIVINSTDLATGMRFPFTSWAFNLICADLDSYPVSRGVAASSAVPVLLSPITLKNFSGTCGYQAPAWLEDALKEKGITSSRKMEARGLVEYFDQKKRPWIHLVDGGISDNLGLRTFYNSINLMGDPHRAFSELRHNDVRRILIISVNANASPASEWTFERAAPGLSEVIGAITSDQIGRYSTDTMEIVGSSFKIWAEQVSTPDRPVTMNFVEVSFQAVQDTEKRHYLNNIGTNFDLEDEQVDHLISAAREVLRTSPELKRFMDSSREGSKPGK
jgi:NTE family protein